MIKEFRKATVSKEKKRIVTMRPKVRGKMKDWEIRRLWRKMFEEHRKTIVKKLLNGEEPTNNSQIPPNSKCFWENIFKDRKSNLIKLATNIAYSEDDEVKQLADPVTEHEVIDQWKKISIQSAGGPDGMKRGMIKKRSKS